MNYAYEKALSDGWIYKQKRTQNKVGRALFAVGACHM